MKEDSIKKKDIINEIMNQKRLCIDVDVIAEVCKSLNERYSEDESFPRWGSVHFSAVKDAISRQAKKDIAPPRNYLCTLKVNYDAMTDNSLIKMLLVFIGIIISTVLALKSACVSSGSTNYILVQSFVILLLVFLYYFIISIVAKYSYKNMFYKQIIECLLEENNLLNQKTNN